MITENDGCPVAEELIGRLYTLPIAEIDGIISRLPPGSRGSLATFCYGRAHLRDIGLAIAATCDLETLIDAGGRAGHEFVRSVARAAAGAQAAVLLGAAAPDQPGCYRRFTACRMRSPRGRQSMMFSSSK